MLRQYNFAARGYHRHSRILSYWRVYHEVHYPWRPQLTPFHTAARPQARAIFEAAVSQTRAGVVVKPDVMVPLVGSLAELRHQENVIRAAAEAVMTESGVQVGRCARPLILFEGVLLSHVTVHVLS